MVVGKLAAIALVAALTTFSGGCTGSHRSGSGDGVSGEKSSTSAMTPTPLNIPRWAATNCGVPGRVRVAVSRNDPIATACMRAHHRITVTFRATLFCRWQDFHTTDNQIADIHDLTRMPAGGWLVTISGESRGTAYVAALSRPYGPMDGGPPDVGGGVKVSVRP